jgi:2-keto-4-pentenoate hydratase/2-oxohepta-3-ene-1,7-dioic acid hydratase in catechol pathway
MNLATAVFDGAEAAVLVDPGRGVVAVDDLVDGGPFPTALQVLSRFAATELAERLADAGDRFRPVHRVRFTAPYRRPRKVWGIGLNYVEHAADLAERSPTTEPASFLKGDHTIIGPDEEIPLPWQSERVTAEAELGLVIGRHCRDVTPDDALDYVWGVVPVLDQTAEDILARNPRFLTRAKNFPGFFSFGPHIVPMHDVLESFGDLAAVTVATVRNGAVRRADTVAHMIFGPRELVSFHSQMMPLFPGDIISTGTPGAVQVHPGDVVECRIEGIGTLRNTVVAGPARPDR